MSQSEVTWAKQPEVAVLTTCMSRYVRTHLPDGGLVPIRQASCPHSLGADPRRPGLLSDLRPCSVPTRRRTQPRFWNALSLRWQLEVTFHEVRTHLGVETQRQWSDLAIARTTPALLGLISWTTLATTLRCSNGDLGDAQCRLGTTNRRKT